MPLPPLQYWTKMPSVMPTAATPAAYHAALQASLSSAVDAFGVAVPANHAWTFAAITPILTQEGIECSPPAGSAFVGKVLIVGALVGATPKICPATPGDAYYPGHLYMGYSPDAGCVLANWGGGTVNDPLGAGKYWAGFQNICNDVQGMAIGWVRAYLSDEKIAIEIMADNVNKPAIGPGIIDPLLDHPSVAESNGRIWGLVNANGAGGIGVDWCSGSVDGFMTFFGGQANAQWAHGVYKIPGAANVALFYRADRPSYSNALQYQLANTDPVTASFSVYSPATFSNLGKIRDVFYGPWSICNVTKTDTAGRKWFSFANPSATVLGQGCWLPGVL